MRGTLLLLLAVPVVVWLALLFTVFKAIWDGRGDRLQKAASSPGGVALQISLAVLLVLVVLDGMTRSLLERWLMLTAALPIALPVFAAAAWSKFYGVLWLPLLSALLLSAAAVAAWMRYTTGRLRLLWPTALVSTASAAFLIVGEAQFHRDVRMAATALGAECLEAGTFHDAIATAMSFQSPPFHAAARKGDDLFGWSFKERAFYKVTGDAGRSTRSRRSASFVTSLPPCWPPNPYVRR